MGRWAWKCKACGHRYTWNSISPHPIPPCPKCNWGKATKGKESPHSLDANDDERRQANIAAALEQCDTILSLCDDMPDRASDFAISVAEQCAEVRETIERMQRVTSNQQEALDNWEAGLNRWLRD